MKHFLLSLTAVLFLISCGAAETPTPTITKTAVSHPSPVPTSTVPPPTVTQTAVPIPTASATATPEMPTPTITAVTLTPLPTFAPDELETAVDELLANPMDCDVPCWWGAIPDRTTVFDIQQFLDVHQFEYYKRDDDNNQIPDYIELWFTEDQFDFRVGYLFQHNTLQTVFSEESPPLYEVLKKYGSPDEVRFSTMSFEREDDLPVRLNLVYLQIGMAVGYVIDGDIQSNSVVRGCFFDEDTGILQLVPLNSTISYKDFAWVFELDRRYLLLEEATDMKMEGFMEFLDNPNQPYCVETPTELWD